MGLGKNFSFKKNTYLGVQKNPPIKRKTPIFRFKEKGGLFKTGFLSKFLKEIKKKPFLSNFKFEKGGFKKIGGNKKKKRGGDPWLFQT